MIVATPAPREIDAFSIGAGWDDVPHLDESAKAALVKDYLPYQIDARTKGLPLLGAGVVYPVDPAVYTEEDFDLPKHWPRAFALDVGWNRTAALWGAWDRTSDVIHCYSEHYVGEEKPQVHADTIKTRGAWIPGVIDPASRGRTQLDGTRLMEEYINLGLDLDKAENAVEAGLLAVYRRMVSGRLKVFRSLRNFASEIRKYHRDERGKIVKKDDHLMDDLRYLVMTGMSRAMCEPRMDNWRAPRERKSSTGY